MLVFRRRGSVEHVNRPPRQIPPRGVGKNPGLAPKGLAEVEGSRYVPTKRYELGGEPAYNAMHRAQLDEAVQGLRSETVAPLAFAGLVKTDGNMKLVSFAGNRTNSLVGIEVSKNAGLGGRVFATGQAHAVTDYLEASSITHHYDQAVSAEGFRGVLAVPVAADGRPLAVLYCAAREPGPLADAAVEATVQVARRLGDRLSAIDAVKEAMRSGAVYGDLREHNQRQEQRRQAYGEMRALVEQVSDPKLRRRLHATLARATGVDRTGHPIMGLSPREIDMLSQVAMGSTNQEIARAFSISPETVKSYLRNAFTKLDARSRVEAVKRARLLGYLP